MTSLRVGYHYCADFEWAKIQVEGLVPQVISHPGVRRELARYFKGEPLATWIWAKALAPESHAGTLVLQAARKGSPRICVLRVRYTSEDRLVLPEGFTYTISHDGAIENWRYHASERAILLGSTLPPKRVKLVGYYDLVGLLGRRTA